MSTAATGDEGQPATEPTAGGPSASAALPPMTAPVTYGPRATPASPVPAMIASFPQTDPAPPQERVRTILAAALAAITVAVGGLGLGLLWLQLSPRLGIVKVAEGFVYADQEPEEAIAADGVFGIIGAGAGIAMALLAWVVLRRYRGVAVLVGLVIGSLASAWLAWWLGVRMGLAQFEAVRDTVPVGTRIEGPLVLRLTDLDRAAYWPPKVTGVVAAQALAMAATYTTLASFSIYPVLRPPRRRPQAELSSGPAVPVDPRG